MLQPEGSQERALPPIAELRGGGGRRGEMRTTTVRRNLVYGRTETISNTMFCSNLSKDKAGNLNRTADRSIFLARGQFVQLHKMETQTWLMTR